MNSSKRYFKRKVKKQILKYKQRVLYNEKYKENFKECENFENNIMPQMCLEEEVTQEHELQRIPEKIILRQKLKKWIIKTKPTRSCAEELLAILSEEGMDVPLSVEGLLRAKTKIVVRSVPPGSFHYLGIENELKKVEDILQNYATVELDVNVDGIPLFKSSRTQLWPILIKVVNVKEKIMPMPVGIFVGPGKPHCVENFFKDVIAVFSDDPDTTLRKAFQSQKKRLFKANRLEKLKKEQTVEAVNEPSTSI